MRRLHLWIERTTGLVFGVARSHNTDFLLWVRIGNGRGYRGLCHFEAGIGNRLFYLAHAPEVRR